MDPSMIILFQITVLVFSAIIHEYMHGWMADRLGDPTAKNLGRLTLNPLPHIDPFGSILLPAILVLTNAGFVFGWAKPVPYNPYNLRDQKYGGAKVAAAGPLANLITAVFFGIVARLLPITSSIKVGIINSFFSGDFNNLGALISGNLLHSIYLFSIIIIFINLLLMVFNLLPIPPLDGSKVLAPFLPYSWQLKFAAMERFGLLIVLAFVMLGFFLIIPVITFLFRLIVGF